MGRGPTAADTSDLKPSALFLFPLRSALFLRRLCRFLLRFLLPVHTLAHSSSPHGGERLFVRANDTPVSGPGIDRPPPIQEAARAARSGLVSAACAHQHRQLAVRSRRLVIGQTRLLSHEGSESLREQRRAEVKSLVLIASQLRQ